MIYTKNELERAIDEGQSFDYLGFWGQAETDQMKVLSNFYRRPFKAPLLHGDKDQLSTFTCSEQYFMYLKAITFNDLPIAKQIIENQTGSGKDYKRLGRLVGTSAGAISYDDHIWSQQRENAMYTALTVKFKDPQMRRLLLSTGNKVLIEASPFDTIWGVGLGKRTKQGMYDKSERWKDVKQWRGENLLGFLLMRIRDEIQS